MKFFLLAAILLIQLATFITLRRLHHMSKSADLTTAVQSLTDAVNKLTERIANVTPDADVQAQIDALNSLTTQVNSLAQ